MVRDIDSEGDDKRQTQREMVRDIDSEGDGKRHRLRGR